MKLSTTLEALSVDPSAETDLARIALLIARDAYSSMKPRAYLRRIDRLAEQLRPRLKGSLAARTAELSTFLFEECGFAGNTEDYYDPRNSYLNKVLDRQVGLPIALSVLAMAVGQRAGLDVVGVGLPGHFIVKAVDGNEEVLFDPFNGGQFLDIEGCEELVGGVTGRPFEATPEALAATPPGAIVARMLQNLKTAYLAERDYRRGARVTRRLTQLIPADASQQRDLGVLLVQAEQFGRAVDPLRAYLRAEPGAEDAADVRKFLDRALNEVARWN
ncbi:transglutaminase-like domain-containing protein [Gemmata sp. JC673]|uniref:Transglutaminase-like domain-containing protein n=1 Tax=Gemmata algarum TaxID=2975278 RepID=A0ABU5EVF0_9BACT|nr:transglutaminase-like domain-containing protein [Gemmata algarum]MDY3559165.1 transglutaminase-like domain-containing protein [Gemmata algarum]